MSRAIKNVHTQQIQFFSIWFFPSFATNFKHLHCNFAKRWSWVCGWRALKNPLYPWQCFHAVFRWSKKKKTERRCFVKLEDIMPIFSVLHSTPSKLLSTLSLVSLFSLSLLHSVKHRFLKLLTALLLYNNTQWLLRMKASFKPIYPRHGEWNDSCDITASTSGIMRKETEKMERRLRKEGRNEVTFSHLHCHDEKLRDA